MLYLIANSINCGRGEFTTIYFSHFLYTCDLFHLSFHLLLLCFHLWMLLFWCWVKGYSERLGQVLNIFPGHCYRLPPSSIYCSVLKLKICLRNQIQKKKKALHSRYTCKIVLKSSL